MEEFLRRIWGDTEGYVFLPRKANKWIEPAPLEWPYNHPLAQRIDLDADSYFCPQVFSSPRRIKANALPSRWLYADLDSVNPRKLALQPTIAIQTSPGRYQAFWQLERDLPPKRLEEFNRRVTYATGADKGGWHLGKVLRIPGTHNFKYSSPREVKVLWDTGSPISIRELEDFVASVETHELEPSVSGLVLPAETVASIRKRLWERLDQRGKDLMEGKVEPGEEGRSGLLWELECRLFEAGLEPEEVFVVVRECPWNKFKDRRNGDGALWQEVRKAHLHVGSQREVDSGTGLVRLRPRIISYADLLSSAISEPDWLVEDWWTLGSHGIIAGLPKSYKSLITLDLVVSIASETDFLGHHPVNRKGAGPALVVQQENSQALLRDRLWKITTSRGIHKGKVVVDPHRVTVEFPPAIPLLFYNDFAFDMSMPDDREAIEKIIQDEGIKMVVFDPLYLMIGGADENKAHEMRPILSWLLRLRNLYGCAVIVVHHWGKGTHTRGGKGVGGIRLLGSTTIYGWLEAALYLEASRTQAGTYEVVVEREFRERLSPPPSGYRLEMGDVGETKYEWATGGPTGSGNRLIWLVTETPGITIKELSEQVNVGQKKLREELTYLIDEEVIEVRTEGRLKRFFIHGYSE